MNNIISVFKSLKRSSDRVSRNILLRKQICYYSMSKMNYSTRKIGSLNTKDFKVYLEDEQGDVISFFHDVPLFVNKEKGVLNMVVEIPRWTNAKLEISKEDLMNPIVHDVSKGKVRFVKNIFPFHGYIWNYGALPQTWEDPVSVDPYTQTLGDNDPLDVLEIGSSVSYTGEIKQVKVLGAIALIDGGEADWKILAIDINDPLANKMETHEDIEKYFPGLLKETKNWLRIYKIPEGKPENVLAFNGKTFDKETAFEVINRCSFVWESLIKGENSSINDKYNISTTNMTILNSKFMVKKDSPDIIGIPAQDIVEPALLPMELSHWHYIKSS